MSIIENEGEIVDFPKKRELVDFARGIVEKIEIGKTKRKQKFYDAIKMPLTENAVREFVRDHVVRVCFYDQISWGKFYGLTVPDDSYADLMYKAMGKTSTLKKENEHKKDNRSSPKRVIALKRNYAHVKTTLLHEIIHGVYGDEGGAWLNHSREIEDKITEIAEDFYKDHRTFTDDLYLELYRKFELGPTQTIIDDFIPKGFQAYLVPLRQLFGAVQ